jgi:hypothetical protein
MARKSPGRHHFSRPLLENNSTAPAVGVDRVISESNNCSLRKDFQILLTSEYSRNKTFRIKRQLTHQFRTIEPFIGLFPRHMRKTKYVIVHRTS